MDKNFVDHLKLELKALKEDVYAISGDWNGDESGIEEDRAHCADEISHLANELIEALEGMQEYGTPNSYSGLFNEFVGRDEWQPMLDKLTIVKN